MIQEMNPQPVYTYIRIQLRIAIHSSAKLSTRSYTLYYSVRCSIRVGEVLLFVAHFSNMQPYNNYYGDSQLSLYGVAS